MNTETEWKDTKVDEAYHTMMKQQAIENSTGTKKLELDRASNTIHLTNYPSNNSSLVINDVVCDTIAIVENHDWLDYCENAKRHNDLPDCVIAETNNTVWDDLGRVATTKEIEDHDFDEDENVRVIENAKAYDSIDWTDEYQNDIITAQNVIDDTVKLS